MAIVLVQNVPLIGQPSDGVCWWASCQMIYKWSQATSKGSMVEPDSDEGFRKRHESNGDWYCGKNGFLADALKMKKFSSLTLDFNTVNDFLALHGPVFTSVQKNWDGNDYGHAVVMCGVADTGVLINDPMPINTGTKKWLTWEQIKKAVAGVAGDADFQYLSAA
jgi:hypothetical protein